MARKICNNKVTFCAGGKELLMRLSDHELKTLRRSSIYTKNENCDKFIFGNIYNFAIYALLDYDWKSRSKSERFYKTFPYHDYSEINWLLEIDENE